MSNKAIAGLVGVVAVVAAGFAATAVLGDDPQRLPPYATVEVEMRGPSATPAGQRLERARQRNKPQVLYFSGQGQVDVAQTGPYVDVELTAQPPKACPRVVDGGVAVANLDIYQQGSSVGPGRGEYHVLIGFDDGATPVNFAFTSHLVCLKNVK